MTLPTFEASFAVVVALAIFSVVIERALSLVYEHPWWLATGDRIKGTKEIGALLLSYSVCRYLGFDALQLLANHPDSHSAGLWVTAATIAGGSKGSVKLFQGFLDVKSSAARRAEGGGP